MKNYFIVDLGKDKSSYNAYISNTLITQIQETLQQKKKVLLYINKRGLYDLLICSDCSHIIKCPRCDIALSVHTSPSHLECHHCSYSQDLLLSCPECSGVHLKAVGVGTQQIETTIAKLFPQSKIFRLDSDNIKNISQKRQSLENMKSADIIIGTKMMTTGFDFHDIGVIGVILLEQELQIPAYDTEERIYQNIKQLIGRGGRVGNQTNIVLQTLVPNSDFMKNITELNYKEFFQNTLKERKMFHYPPFTQMATLRYKHPDKSQSQKFISELFQKLLSFQDPSCEIIKLENVVKRDNQYFSKIILKGNEVRNLLNHIKTDILLNKDLVVIFE